MENETIIYTSSDEETESFGERFVQQLKPGDVVALIGDLGAGKTSLVRGMAKGLSIKDLVSSPTFTLLNEYRGTIPLYHFDVYRLANSMEIEDLDVEDYFYGNGICVVEWAEKARQLLPEHIWQITIEWTGEHTRTLHIESPEKRVD